MTFVSKDDMKILNDQGTILMSTVSSPGDCTMLQLGFLFKVAIQNKPIIGPSGGAVKYRNLLSWVTQGIHDCGNEEATYFQLFKEHPQVLLNRIATFGLEDEHKDVKLKELYGNAFHIFNYQNITAAVPVYHHVVNGGCVQDKSTRNTYTRMMTLFVFFIVCMSQLYLYNNTVHLYKFILTNGGRHHAAIDRLLSRTRSIMHIVFDVGFTEPGRYIQHPDTNKPIEFKYTEKDEGLFAREECSTGDCEFPDDNFKVHNSPFVTTAEAFSNLVVTEKFSRLGHYCLEVVKNYIGPSAVFCRSVTVSSTTDGGDFNHLVSSRDVRNPNNYYVMYDMSALSSTGIKYAVTAMISLSIESTTHKVLAYLATNSNITRVAVNVFQSAIPTVDYADEMFSETWKSMKTLPTTCKAILTVLLGVFMIRVKVYTNVASACEATGTTPFGDVVRAVQRKVGLYGSWIPNNFFIPVFAGSALFGVFYNANAWRLFLEFDACLIVWLVVGSVGSFCYILVSAVSLLTVSVWSFLVESILASMGFSPVVATTIVSILGTGGLTVGSVAVANSKKLKVPTKAQAKKLSTAARRAFSNFMPGVVAPVAVKAVATTSLYDDMWNMCFNAAIVLDVMSIANAVFVLYSENFLAFACCMNCSLRIFGVRHPLAYGLLWTLLAAVFMYSFLLAESPVVNEYWRWPMTMDMVVLIDESKRPEKIPEEGSKSVAVYTSYLFFSYGCFVCSGYVTVITRGLMMSALTVYHRFCKPVAVTAAAAAAAP